MIDFAYWNRCGLFCAIFAKLLKKIYCFWTPLFHWIKEKKRFNFPLSFVQYNCMLLLILYYLILVGVGEKVLLLLTSLLPLISLSLSLWLRFFVCLRVCVCVCVCVCVWRGSLSLSFSLPVCMLIQMTKQVFNKLSKHTSHIYNRVLKVGFLFVKATLYWVSNDGIFSSPKLESTQPKCGID